MKVAELEGVLLDYWVARAEDLLHPHIDDGICWVEEPACDRDPAGALDTAFSPASDWAVGGPIIDVKTTAYPAPTQMSAHCTTAVTQHPHRLVFASMEKRR